MRAVRFPHEVFLSHATADRKTADLFAEVLRANGVPVWYSRTNIVAARQWHDEIGEALRRCDWFVVLVSRASVKSKWVKRELLFALNDSRYEGRIVPILLQRCDVAELSWTIESLQFIRHSRDFGATLTQLFRSWGQGVKLPPDLKRGLAGKRRRRRR
jgi:hypothetical protein